MILHSSPRLVPNTPDTDPERVLPRNPYPAYGMPDLNPLGGIRDGGMLYDPMRVRNRNRWILDGYGVDLFVSLLLFTNINLWYGNLGFLR